LQIFSSHPVLIAILPYFRPG